MIERKDFSKSVLVAGFLSMLAGSAGMALSFLYLASASMADITAGTSGFVAGAVFIGSGLIACSTVAGTGSQEIESRS